MTVPHNPAAAERVVRPDIQALRAIACLSIVAYHLWPQRITGGYVGVDVFFVISGFLITGHLLREVTRTGRIALAAFWARRARRLLPAALLVLAASAAGVFAFVPMAYWSRFFGEIVASALYGENWTLAASAVDYWAADNIASPAQHYWSLSVEEQFYLLWPLLILLAWRLRGNRTRILAVLLTVVSVLSLAYCVYVTFASPAAAYFVTPARVWEFGLGGLLALATRTDRVPDRLRSLIAWLGWAAITVTLFSFTDQTSFPGYTALLPALGTAAVIWSANPAARWSPTRATGWRPLQFAGDISYSVYLWHWPLIVLLPFAIGAPLGIVAKIAILVVTLLLGWATKRFLEDPARTAPLLANARPRRSLLSAGAGMVLVSVLATGGIAAVALQPTPAETAAQGQKAHDGCFGAPAALDADCELYGTGEKLYPAPSTVVDDKPGNPECFVGDGTPTHICHFGSEKPGALRVALIGNSHAQVMLEALASLPLADEGWSLDTFIGQDGLERWTDTQQYPQIQDSLLNGPAYDVVLISYNSGHGPLEGQPDPRAAQLSELWAPVIERGSRLIAIVDNPLLPDSAIACVLASSNPAGAGACSIDTQEAYKYNDPLRDAVDLTPGADIVELGDLYCVASECPLVIGNVLVYRDTNHLSATYAHTLAPYLLQRVEEVLDTPAD